MRTRIDGRLIKGVHMKTLLSAIVFIALAIGTGAMADDFSEEAGLSDYTTIYEPDSTSRAVYQKEGTLYLYVDGKEIVLAKLLERCRVIIERDKDERRDYTELVKALKNKNYLIFEILDKVIDSNNDKLIEDIDAALKVLKQ